MSGQKTLKKILLQNMSFFKIEHKCTTTKARTGVLNFDRGEVHTPVFMPIGTLGSVKGLTMNEMNLLGSEIILGNTYHLWLKPGVDVISHFEGLHNFNTWERPILTDSGGFQAFSLSKIRKFTEEGVTFRVASNGDKKFLSPEISMQIQTELGSDIALVLDECLPAEVTHKQALNALNRTYRWAKRSQAEFARLQKPDEKYKRRLFGIPQGAQFNDLREMSAKMIMSLDFEGYSIGGVANGGEPEEIMYSQVLAQTNILEEYKPKHLLGVGTPIDIVNMVACGIDMFDCVYPTRNARHGSIFIKHNDYEYSSVQISAAKFILDKTPINANSRFQELRSYSRGYLCHLFRSKELLAYRLATLNNIEYYTDLMTTIRENIKNGSYGEFKNQFKKIELK
jgi:queuine tRNA-ribosyltransferase